MFFWYILQLLFVFLQDILTSPLYQRAVITFMSKTEFYSGVFPFTFGSTQATLLLAWSVIRAGQARHLFLGLPFFPP